MIIFWSLDDRAWNTKLLHELCFSSPQHDEISNVVENLEEDVKLTLEISKAETSTVNVTTSPPSTVTPRKMLTEKQLEKKLLSEKKQKQRDRIKEEKLKVIEEKKKIKQEEYEKKALEKQKKLEQKQRENEEKQKIKEEKRKKEQEEKEIRRKEKEEKEEQKRKEQMEKSFEKQKLAEKKEKTVAAFVNFFTKRNDVQIDDKTKEVSNSSAFMPFEIKSDMKLAPSFRFVLNENDKSNLSKILKKQDCEVTYLQELKSGKKIGRGDKTWPMTETTEDDVVLVIEDANPGETIEEQTKIINKVKAKFFKFDGSRRPAYFGTWRKKSASIKPRKPFAVDTLNCDYDIDSDEEWEEEDSGESLRGSEDDKENDSENEYEEDNEFFVPHGHLSDDELDDEENISPEAHKAKLKLLKKEFEEEMRCKTEKIKPRVIGCIWYNKDGSNVDSAIDNFLKPLAIISDGTVSIKKRQKIVTPNSIRRSFLRGKELDIQHMPNFLKCIHGNTKNSKSVIEEFLNSFEKQKINVNVSKTRLVKRLKKFAVWTRHPEGGPVLKKHLATRLIDLVCTIVEVATRDDTKEARRGRLDPEDVIDNDTIDLCPEENIAGDLIPPTRSVSSLLKQVLPYILRLPVVV
ncbi:hypothetical protein FQA39_LY14562 [Lamprigera yunnana]|nr:hypothetical protein FQA39_LY14562 [Lamprigera yunnana]